MSTGCSDTKRVIKNFVCYKMEEVPDEQYEESEKAEEEPVEPVEPVEPEPAKVCKKVRKDLEAKVQCQGCLRWMSAHTLAYQHRCRAQTVAELAASLAAELAGTTSSMKHLPVKRRDNVSGISRY